MVDGERNLVSGPILIGGTGRSGTTLLARIIGEHPSIFTFRWETQFMVSPNGLIDLIRSHYAEKALETFLTNLRGRWFRRIMRANTPREYEAGLCTDISESELETAIEAFLRDVRSDDRNSLAPARKLIQGIAKPAMERTAAIRWSEKTPRNVLYTDVLHDLLPDMRMIHIVRDGRDVAVSMANNGFWPIGASKDLPELRGFSGKVTPEKAALYWQSVLELSRARASELPDGAYMELRYEDLVTEPEKVLSSLCDFLEEEFTISLAEAVDIRPGSIGRWRSELTAEQLREIHRSIGTSLAAEGYDS